MKNMWIALPLAGVALSACVTINIYFPAAAAEKAADKIIDEVWQSQKTDKPSLKENEGKPGTHGTKKEEVK